MAWRLPATLDRARVPRFALQTRVENAVKHNRDRRAPLAIVVDGERHARGVRLWVRDDGRGFADTPARTDGGLWRLEETLGLLHRTGARLSRRRSAEGGAHVELELPVGADR